jgi:PRTRC genetic system ThiF family protein
MGLPYLHQALKVWGHSYGLRVTAIDPDTVSPTNCVRQPFSQSDIGQYKAEVLIGRLNQFWGLNWDAITTPYDKAITRVYSNFYYGCSTITVGCVDSRRARHQILTNTGGGYWLDFGNSPGTGQFVLGQFKCDEKRRRTEAPRLPLVTELFSEIADPTLPEEDLPSCSALEAIERQEPFVNQCLANAGLSMLTQLLRYGQLSFHGGFFNMKTGAISPIKVDEALWRRMQGKRKERGRSSVQVAV